MAVTNCLITPKEQKMIIPILPLMRNNVSFNYFGVLKQLVGWDVKSSRVGMSRFRV